MKKILFALALLISVSAGAQLKISAMPVWTTTLDSTWFPIIYNDGTVWINYRAQGWQIGKERIDSIVNNWPSGLLRFAVSGEDDVAAETRLFNLGDHIFSIATGVSSEDLTFMKTAFNVWSVDAATPANQAGFQSGAASGIQTNASMVARFGGTHNADIVTLASSSLSYFHVDLGDDPKWDVVGLGTGTYADVLYYDSGTGDIKWGAAPGGGGSESTTASNGLTLVGLDVQLKGTLTQLDTIDATSSYYLLMTGNAAYTFRATTVANRAIFGEATGAGVGVTGQAASGSAGIGVQGISDNVSGVGVQGSSVAGIGVLGSTNTGWAASLTAEPSSTNTAAQVARILRSTSGTAANGIGGYLSFWLEYSSPTTTDEAARIGATYTDISARSSDLNFSTKLSNSMSETMTLKSAGNLVLNTTGKAYAEKSPDGTVWYILVSNAGVLSTTTTAP